MLLRIRFCVAWHQTFASHTRVPKLQNPIPVSAKKSTTHIATMENPLHPQDSMLRRTRYAAWNPRCASGTFFRSVISTPLNLMPTLNMGVLEGVLAEGSRCDGPFFRRQRYWPHRVHGPYGTQGDTTFPRALTSSTSESASTSTSTSSSSSSMRRRSLHYEM